MEPIDRREFVTCAGSLALAALTASPAAAGATETESPPTADDDPTAALNARFRALYGANRTELGTTVPLAAVTFIGTGVIHRIERGRAVQAYEPPAWLAQTKGLMHAVIGAQGTAARLVRGTDPAAAHAAARDLHTALQQAVALVPQALPEAIQAPAGRVLAALAAMAHAWAAGQTPAAGDFAAGMARVQADLNTVLDVAGEGAFAAVADGLRACAADCDPAAWARALVLVCGPPFGRRDSIDVAAAMSVLGREALGTRLLYLDNVYTLDAAISQIAGATADRELGRDVFGDPYRMWRDLLGDVARRHAGGGFFPDMGRP